MRKNKLKIKTYENFKINNISKVNRCEHLVDIGYLSEFMWKKKGKRSKTEHPDSDV